MVLSEMCENWKYERLHEAVRKRAFQEIKHADDLIARILFLEGRPVVSTLKAINIGPEAEAQFDQIKQMGSQNYLVEQVD